jgi:hypothetical protein
LDCPPPPLWGRNCQQEIVSFELDCVSLKSNRLKKQFFLNDYVTRGKKLPYLSLKAVVKLLKEYPINKEKLGRKSKKVMQKMLTIFCPDF